VAPVGVNWGWYSPQQPTPTKPSERFFDSAKQDEPMAKAHEQVVDDAS
jgi:peptide/nickel transport system substrate-binding protein